MNVQNILDTYTPEESYVINSMIIKSFDNLGCTYKWLCRSPNNTAFRREVFIATNTYEETIESRTVITSIEVTPGQ